MEANVSNSLSLLPTKRSNTKASIALADDLKAAIVRGALKAGARLPSEEELIQQSGYSRATVRESLRVLEREGLVDIRRGANGGLFVRHPDHASIARSLHLLLQFNHDDPRMILEARRELESLCTRLAATRISLGEITRLRESVERLKGMSDSRAAARENLVFHLNVVEATRNTVLQALVGAVRSLLYDSTIRIYYSQEKVRDAAEAHDKIVDALEDRNPPLSAHRMSKHLAAFEDYLVETGQVNRLLDEPKVIIDSS
jgi:DNA-binding FadR family transcriptional regulator